MEARFVDGGMLSNFPIREFHNPGKAVPRFPTLGARLGVNEKKLIVRTSILASIWDHS
ncbi:MAG: hypothetical protein IPI23_22075 [Bacteroidetes bacterium]|nr:hypothetical protein [Bacteroidota bacterium]